MRIALCLSGYFENAGGLFESLRGNEYIKRKIISNNNVDVFVHSWDMKNEKIVKKAYNITSCIFEEQKDFKKILKECDEGWFFGPTGKAPGMYSTNNIFKTLSVSYSIMKSVELKKKYEIENNFVYDTVIIGRFDLGQRGKQHKTKYYATNINFNPKLNMEYVYSAFWDQLNHGFADHWFFSNSKNIDILSKLHTKLPSYYQKDSEYVNSVLNHWPDSNSKDQFSNEFFLDEKQKSKNLKKWDKWACVDNHKLYKWYMIDTGLYKKCKFIDITKDL